VENLEAMNKVIIKHSLPQNDQRWTLNVLRGSVFLSAIINERDQTISIYYLCDQEPNETEIRVIADIGTGRPFNNSDPDLYYKHLATLSQHEGNIIHHLFEVIC
jgi:hypothetical protein